MKNVQNFSIQELIDQRSSTYQTNYGLNILILVMMLFLVLGITMILIPLTHTTQPEPPAATLYIMGISFLIIAAALYRWFKNLLKKERSKQRALKEIRNEIDAEIIRRDTIS